MKHFLASQYKDENGSFIDFSQNRKAQLLSAQNTAQHKDLSWHKIPIQKQQKCAEVVYVTALPQLVQKTSRSKNSPDFGPLTFQEMACSFTKQLRAFQLKSLIDDSLCTEETLSALSNLWRSFKIGSERPGWISFQLSNPGIYTWINQLQNIGQMAERDHTLVIKKLPLKPIENDLISHAGNSKKQRYAKAHADQIIWRSQYTYARCCTLLRCQEVISRQKDMVLIKDVKDAQEEALARLELIFQRTQTAPTRQLIHVLIETADDMFWLPKRYPNQQYFLLLKRAEQLNLAFDQFHRANALTPNTSQPFPYLTLVNSTRNLLKLLLHSYLQVMVPRYL